MTKLLDLDFEVRQLDKYLAIDIDAAEFNDIDGKITIQVATKLSNVVNFFVDEGEKVEVNSHKKIGEQTLVKDWENGYALDVEFLGDSLYFDLPKEYTIREHYNCILNKEDENTYHVDDVLGGKFRLIIDKDESLPVANIIQTDLDEQPAITEVVETPATPKVEVKSSSPNKNLELHLDFKKHKVGTPYGRAAQKVDGVAVNFSGGGMDKYTRVAKKDGVKCLEVDYPANPEKGWTWHRQFAALLTPRREYIFSYQMMFSDNFVFKGNKKPNSGIKFPGLAQIGDTPKGKKLCSGGQTCHGKNGFTLRYMSRKSRKHGLDQAEMVVYEYTMSKKKKWGEDVYLNFELPRGEWFEMKQRVLINTGNEANGELEVWCNGEHKLLKKNMKMVTNGKGIDCMYFSTFHGGAGHDWRPNQDCKAWFKDIKVWSP